MSRAGWTHKSVDRLLCDIVDPRCDFLGIIFLRTQKGKARSGWSALRDGFHGCLHEDEPSNQVCFDRLRATPDPPLAGLR